MPDKRRRAVNLLLRSGIFASLASFLYPVVRFLRPPRIPEAPVNEITVAGASAIAPNSARIVKFAARPVLLIRVSESEWRAFGATCTHLDCTVQYRSESQQIWCACHNGFYDLNGRVVAGPPPRPLEEYVVRVRGEEVVIARRN